MKGKTALRSDLTMQHSKLKLTLPSQKHTAPVLLLVSRRRRRLRMSLLYTTSSAYACIDPNVDYRVKVQAIEYRKPLWLSAAVPACEIMVETFRPCMDGYVPRTSCLPACTVRNLVRRERQALTPRTYTRTC